MPLLEAVEDLTLVGNPEAGDSPWLRADFARALESRADDESWTGR